MEDMLKPLSETRPYVVTVKNKYPEWTGLASCVLFVTVNALSEFDAKQQAITSIHRTASHIFPGETFTAVSAQAQHS